MAVPGVDTSTGSWAAHRRRAETLRAHHAFAGEVLTLYLALLDVWTAAGDAAREQAPEPRALAAWAAEHVLPRVVGATVEAGPELLADATRKLVERAKSLLTTKMGLTEPEAFRWIQKTSMDRRLSMREVAETIINQVN